MLESFTPSFYKQLQQLKIRTRRAFLGSRQGGHVSLRRGHGLEFSDHRAYAPGDDFRHIDWNVFARNDRLCVRQFQEEQDLNVLFLIDTSQSMAFPSSNNKFGLACRLALALGYVALSDGDTVTFVLLGQKSSPRFVGAKSLSRAAKFLSESEPSGKFDPVLETGSAIQRQRIPGKCFIMSDFLFDEHEQFAMLDLLRAKNFEVSLFQILGADEITLDFSSSDMRLVDSETNETIELVLEAKSKREYAKFLADHIEALEKYAVKSGVSHVLISTKEKVTDVVITRLPQIGLLR